MDIVRHPMTLSQLPTMKWGQVIGLPTAQLTFRRLAAYGILPGVMVRVERRVPTLIIQVGAMRIALDRQVAEGIKVQLTNH
ncbi:MAG: ferrous iron transport protein A [Firmicutes bacterium]|nr:ferrous iron transport protein A [Bacillota bacterium]